MTIPLHPTILAAEDSDEDFEAIAEAFRTAFGEEEAQVELRRARSGDECLQELETLPIPPRLLLLDLNLPGYDGRDILQRLRSPSCSYTVPVVVLTTSANPRDVDLCLQHGVNEYHVKPFRYQDHLKLLSDFFTRWRLTLGSTPLSG